MSWLYAAFGMQIRSEIRLSLPEHDRAGATVEETGTRDPWPVDVVIGTIPAGGILPYAIEDIRYGISTAESEQESCIVVDVPWAARYQIQGLSRIVVEPAQGADEQLIGLYLSGLVLAFLLKQRPLITLHGSAVVKAGKALACIGSQGSGKSTTAAWLTTAGYRILCDDVIPIAAGPVVLPGIATAKLLPDAFAKLVGNPDEAGHLFDGVDKYHADLGGSLCPAKLGAIFVLEPAATAAQPGVEPVTGMAKVKTLLEHATSFKALDDAGSQFGRLTQWLGKVPVYRLVRPAAGCDMAVVLPLIIAHGETDEVCDTIS